MDNPPRPEKLTPAIAQRQRARAKDVEQLERKIRQVIANHAPSLACKETGASLDKETLAEIMFDLESLDTGRQGKSIRQTLRLILSKLQKETGGVVELPPLEIVLKRARSPFAPTSFSRVPAFSRTIESFMADLQAHPDVDAQIAAARLVFSAVTFGGLLHPTLVGIFCPLRIANLQRHDDLFWIDLELPKGSEEYSVRIRRWFPDPISRCLIGRWHSASLVWPQGIGGNPATLVRALFKRLGVKPLLSGDKLLHGLLDDAQTRLRLLIPGVLVDFLASDDHGQSLTSHAWWRLIADWQMDSPSTEKLEKEEEEKASALPEIPNKAPSKYRADSSDDLATLNLLKKALKEDEKTYRKRTSALAEINQLREHIGPCGPMLSALVDWTEWRVQAGSSQPQSVYRYLNSFAPALIAAMGELDPTTVVAAEKLDPAAATATAELDPNKVSTSELEERYKQVLANITSSKERVLGSWNLRNFHSFLVMTRDVPPVTIDGLVADHTVVRASSISEHEYERTLDLISRSQPDTYGRDMLRVMLILGYRLGLRRKELAYLRLGDIHDESLTGTLSPRPLAWIHSHPKARVKTSGSVRRLPLAHLLTTEELEEVLEWKRFRKTCAGKNHASHALMFCLQGQETQRLHDREIDVLVKLLRHVCNDNTIVLHTLRHCAISNLFVRLFIAEINRVSVIPIDCPWLIDAPLWKALIKRMFKTPSLPREAAYLVSTIAGHIDPTETMHTYVHHQDWIAGLYLQDSAGTFPLSVWASLESIGVDALMVRHSRQKARSGGKVKAYMDTPRRMMAAFKTIKPPPGERAKVIPTKIDVPVDVRSLLERLTFEGVYNILALEGQSMSKAAREHISGIDRRLSESLRKAAQSIARVTTSARNVESRRSRLMAPQPKRRQPRLPNLPQLDGYGPAIPRERTERRDAHEAYRRAMLPESIATGEELAFLLRHTSHTDPIVSARSLDDVVRLTNVLGELGIPKRRIRIEIHSLPKSVPKSKPDIQALVRSVAKAGSVSAKSVKLAPGELPVTRCDRTHPGGRIEIHVVQEPRASAKHKPDQEEYRLAYGWRVGCYYALCVKKALKDFDSDG